KHSGDHDARSSGDRIEGEHQRAFYVLGAARGGHGGSKGHGQQDEHAHQQISVQQHGQDHAHEHHLHKAPRDRYRSLALYVHGKPTAQDHDSRAEHDGASRLGHSHDDVAVQV